MLPLALISCGGDGSTTTSLTDVEAAPVMAQRLTTVQNDSVVVVGFSPVVTITCDNLGTYTISGIDRTVCQIYNESGSEGIPQFSPNGVDLVSRVPAGDASAVLVAVDADLQNAVWVPVLKSTAVAFGSFDAGTTITGQFTVQGGDASLISGSCDIVDSTGNVDATATLTNTATSGREATLQFNDASGFGLLVDQYQLDCTFTESSVDNSVTAAGNFEVFLNLTSASCDNRPTFTFCEDYTNVAVASLPNIQTACEVTPANTWSTTLCNPSGAVGKCTTTDVYTTERYEYDILNAPASNANCVFTGDVWTALP
ncbi:MAG: hypothetical protein KAU21_16135 [Gammaproteobacteria bacterium]|nr:hypothetical protein [Gammaproteobacteria bacterium]